MAIKSIVVLSTIQSNSMIINDNKSNQKDELISIIVPVYNVENYLRKCVDSIICQTYKRIEIILVDDGSTDSSGAICDNYLERDDRIVVYHKKNGGLSSARNYGIERAHGKYIGFVDSDDYIDYDMYELLFNLIRDNNADLSMCRNIDVYNDTYKKDNKGDSCLVVDSEDAIKYVLEAEIASVSAVNKLYKRELFDNIKYPENKIFEDAFVIVELLDCCETVVITTQQKYYYVHRTDSITTKGFNDRNLDVIQAYEKNYSIIEKKYPSLIETAEMRLCWAYFTVLDKLIYDNSKKNKITLQLTISYLRKRIPLILKNPQFSKARKLSAVALSISPWLYKCCVTLQRVSRPI